MPRRRATSVPAVPISCASASSSTSLAPLARERLDGQHALRVPGDRDGGRFGQIHALAAQRAHGGHLGQQHAGHRTRRPTSGAWRWARPPRRPARGPTASAGTRSDAPRSAHGPPAPAVARLPPPASTARPRCRPRTPVPPTSPARRCPGRRRRRRRARRRSDDRQGHGWTEATPDSSSRPVETLSCSLIVTFRNLLGLASRTYRSSCFVVCGLSCLGGVTCAPLRGHLRFGVESRLAVDTSSGHAFQLH